MNYLGHVDVHAKPVRLHLLRKLPRWQATIHHPETHHPLITVMHDNRNEAIETALKHTVHTFIHAKENTIPPRTTPHE